MWQASFSGAFLPEREFLLLLFYQFPGELQCGFLTIIFLFFREIVPIRLIPPPG